MNTLGWLLIALLAYRTLRRITNMLELRRVLKDTELTYAVNSAYDRGLADGIRMAREVVAQETTGRTFTIDVGHMN